MERSVGGPARSGVDRDQLNATLRLQAWRLTQVMATVPANLPS